MTGHMNDEAEFEALLCALSPNRKKDNPARGAQCAHITPVKEKNIQADFSLQAQNPTQATPLYLTSEDYTRIKVKHWKEQYILPEIHNPVSVGLYALFRAYHALMGNTPLNMQTRYVYRRHDTGQIITAEERKKLQGRIRTDRIAYGLQELYRRCCGGGADWTGYQLMLALSQLTDEGYLKHDGAGGYMTSDKRPERLYNADEFLSFANQSGLAVRIIDMGRIILEGTNETAKKQLRNMLDYSATLGIPDTLRVTLNDRIRGEKVFYDWE